jgi:hypothetical protein
MSIIRIKKENNYSIISNCGLKDERLSWGAVGLYAYLLSLPDDWEIKVEHLKNVHYDGISATRAKLKELENAGYLIKQKVDDSKYPYRIKENGKLKGYNYILHEKSSTFDFLTLKNKSRKSTLENQRIVNTNEINTDNTNNLKKKDIVFSKKNTDPLLKPSIGKIIKKSIEKGNFKKHKLPIDDKDKPTKVILSIQKFLLSMKESNLNKEYNFDKVWKNRNNIIIPNGKYNTISLVRKGLLNSLDVFNEMKKEGNWPENKGWLPKNLKDFIYNPITKMSWFLYCLCNKTKSLNKTISNKNANKIKSKLPNDIQELSEKYCSDIFDKEPNYIFWKKIYTLYEWWDKTFSYYKKKYYDSYVNNFGSFRILLNKIREYSETYNNWHIGNFGMDSGNWDLFREWVKKEYDIKIEKVILK